MIKFLQVTKTFSVVLTIAETYNRVKVEKTILIIVYRVGDLSYEHLNAYNLAHFNRCFCRN